MLKPPPQTEKTEELNDLPWRQFDAKVAEHLPFTRNNSWIWRALTSPEVIARTQDTLNRMRAALETAIASGKIPDENPAHQQRSLLHCRQEQVKTALFFQEKIDHARDRAKIYETAISEHWQASKDAKLVPEAHDEALWATLPSRVRRRHTRSAVE